MKTETNHIVLTVPISGAPSAAAVKLDELEKDGYEILLTQALAERPIAESKLLIVARRK